MIAQASILSTIETLLEGTTGLTTIACIVFDGTNQTAVDTALRDPGCVIVLPPIIKVSPRIQAAGAVLADATFAVRLALNPSVNAAQSTPLVFETVRALIAKAIVAQAAEDNGDRYRLVSDELSDFDPGLLSAILTFEKGVHINPS